MCLCNVCQSTHDGPSITQTPTSHNAQAVAVGLQHQARGPLGQGGRRVHRVADVPGVQHGVGERHPPALLALLPVRGGGQARLQQAEPRRLLPWCVPPGVEGRGPSIPCPRCGQTLDPYIHTYVYTTRHAPQTSSRPSSSRRCSGRPSSPPCST